MPSLMIEVRVMAGSHVFKAIEELCALANKLDLVVIAQMNGVEVLVGPRVDPSIVYKNWDDAIAKGLKFCNGRT